MKVQLGTKIGTDLMGTNFKLKASLKPYFLMKNWKSIMKFQI